MTITDKYFGQTASEYDAKRRHKGSWTTENGAVENMFLRAAQSGPIRSVLDIPCGTGRWIPFFQERDVDYTGVDISKDMIAIATRRFERVTRGTCRSWSRTVSSICRHIETSLIWRSPPDSWAGGIRTRRFRSLSHCARASKRYVIIHLRVHDNSLQVGFRRIVKWPKFVVRYFSAVFRALKEGRLALKHNVLDVESHPRKIVEDRIKALGWTILERAVTKRLVYATVESGFCEKTNPPADPDSKRKRTLMPLEPLARPTSGCRRQIGARIQRLLWQAKHALKNFRPPVDLRNATDDALEAYYRAPGAGGFIIDLSLDRVRTFGPLGLSCAREGGSPFVTTLLAYEQGRCRTYGDSPLRRFYESWQPANLAEAFAIDPSRASKELLALPPLPWMLPWNGGADWDRWINKAKAQIARRTRRLGEAYALSRFWGPVSERYGELRLANLVKVYRSIRVDGYNPVSHIRANLLVRHGECRVLISDGNHRAAALAAAGFDRIPVWVAGRDKYGPAVIWRGDSSSWPAVGSGIFSHEQAVAIFDRVFDANSPALGWNDSDRESTTRPRPI